MTLLREELAKRFGNNNIVELPHNEGDTSLITIYVESQNVTLLMTNGLSDYCMLVPESEKGKEFNEIYFCLPSYWRLNDAENPLMNWVLVWINKLAKYVVEKNTWFGKGHTIPCGNPFQNLSSTMRANHFFLNDPMLLREELQPIENKDKTIRFLGIIPIFEDEMDYKSGKGTLKLIKKLEGHRISEKLDDYRGTILRSRWKMLKK